MITKIFRDFIQSERAGGVLLILCTFLSLSISNSFVGESYLEIWKIQLGPMSVSHWINDGLMTVFFLLVGLELERELFIGELSVWRNAVLPIAAAVGGMIVPAIIFACINNGTIYASGYGIPMATDIAFSLTILSLFSKKVPYGLRVFLTALAIADDLGAIAVIALFYSGSIQFYYLMGSLALFGIMYFMGRKKVYSLWPYLIGGVAMWYCTHHSGIHATISGVMLAFAIPFGKGEHNISHKLQGFLHSPVAFIILPLFALANTCIRLEGTSFSDVLNTGVSGIMLGLIVGKPIGITLFALLAVWIFKSKFPDQVTLKHIVGAGIVAGIGFTMSIFIAELAYSNHALIQQAKIAILSGAALSSLLGILWFRFFIPTPKIKSYS